MVDGCRSPVSSHVTVTVMVALEITWPMPVVLLMLTVAGRNGEVTVVPMQAACAWAYARHMSAAQASTEGTRLMHAVA
ncbi:hypothetical protein D9M70_610460 [compost metagenome]